MSFETNQKFITETYRAELNEKGITDAPKIEEEINVHLRKNQLDGLEELIDKHCEEYGLELEEIRNFLDTLNKDDLIETKEETEVTEKLRPSVEHALRTKISAQPQDESIVRTKEPISNEDRHQLTEAIYREQGKKAFIISKQASLEGRITMELSKTRERFRLLTVLEDKNSEQYFQHFGQSNPNKGFKKTDQHTRSFFRYEFQANHKKYIVFSTEKLEPMRCVLHGTKISIGDQTTLGDNRMIPTDQEVIFVHSHEPAIEPLEQEELDEKRKQIDREWWMQKQFGDFRHPDWYEDAMAATFLAKSDNGYPSHWLQMAAPGTGKSALLNAHRVSMDETNHTFSGQASTVKGLVPSFAENPPKAGYLIGCDRVAAIDEIFDLLSNTVKNGDSRQQDAFRPLLDLLTHTTREFSSGNGSVVGKTDATVLAVGNPAYGLKSIYDALKHNKLDPAFLSRFMLYDQTESHIKYVQDRAKRMSDDEEEHMPERSDEFLSLLDTMRMMRLELDYEKTAEIHDELSEIVPNVFKRAFDARYDHHLKNMVTGIAKLRYLTENRDVLEARPEDYTDAKNIMEMVISSWGDVDMTKLSFNARLNALTHTQREVYEIVSSNPGAEPVQVYEKMSVDAKDNANWILSKLNKLNLIEAIEEGEDKRYYPYWARESQEVRDKREEVMNDE